MDKGTLVIIPKDASPTNNFQPGGLALVDSVRADGKIRCRALHTEAYRGFSRDKLKNAFNFVYKNK